MAGALGCAGCDPAALPERAEGELDVGRGGRISGQLNVWLTNRAQSLLVSSCP